MYVFILQYTTKKMLYSKISVFLSVCFLFFCLLCWPKTPNASSTPANELPQGETRIKLLCAATLTFSPVRYLGSIRRNPIVSRASDQLCLTASPLPISSAWQIISGCRNGFWSRPVPPEFPCHSLFRQDGDCRRKCEWDSRGSYTMHSYFSSHLGWGWVGEERTLSCTCIHTHSIESKHSAQKTAPAASRTLLLPPFVCCDEPQLYSAQFFFLTHLMKGVKKKSWVSHSE